MSVAKTIVVDLGNVQQAIRELREYKREFMRKVEALKTRIAEEIEAEAVKNFAAAVCNDIVGGGMRPASVSISVVANENVTLIIASGADAVFCEFGAGITHNGPVGSSPHPKGLELGMTIGSYGKGMGKRKVWGYYSEEGLVLTRGTPATMPMYNAMQSVCQRFAEIAKEVFA